MTDLPRRRILQSGLLAGIAGLAAPASLRAAPRLPAAPGLRQFDVVTTVDLAEAGDANRLWLPLFQRGAGYQRRTGMTWTTDATVRIDRDRATGTEVLRARWSRSTGPRKLELRERIAVWDHPSARTERLSPRERDFWLRPNTGLPTDGLVAETARRIVGDKQEPRARLRAIYDWVIANTWRDPATAGCGTGDIDAMLRANAVSGAPMGGKCADINSLMVGLCRAAGLPARDIYGVRLAPSKRFKSLGRGGGDITTAQHCRAEAWLDDAGWFAVDPADVRKVVLEEKLPVDSEPVTQLAQTLFGGWEANWGGYNSASGIELVDAPRDGDFHFLMYPCARGASTRANCLDAKNFRYTITSTEVTA